GRPAAHRDPRSAVLAAHPVLRPAGRAAGLNDRPLNDRPGATAPRALDAARDREAPSRVGHGTPRPGVEAGDHRIDAVIAWFSVHGRDLPWRRPGTSPWAILVSEVMLQQTPVVRVLPRWIDWMEHWPAPADL